MNVEDYLEIKCRPVITIEPDKNIQAALKKLVDNSIYDSNTENEQPPKQPTDDHLIIHKQSAGGQQITTNKNERMKDRKKRRLKEEKNAMPSPLPARGQASAWLTEIASTEERRKILKNIPDSSFKRMMLARKK